MRYNFRESKLHEILHNIHFFIYEILPPKYTISKVFKNKFGKKLNWKNPTNVNEKINWLKLYSDTSLWSKCADKLAVRDYINDLGLADLLVPLYGFWKSPMDIDWNLLPQEFVLKANNGSGDVIVVRDKDSIDKEEIIKYYNKILSKPFGVFSGEPHYKKIVPFILAEQLLDSSKQPIESSSPTDFKVWCFHGKPYCIWVCFNRTKEHAYVESHDLDWNYHPEHSVFTGHFLDGKGAYPKPVELGEMLDYAAKISSPFPEVRVDFYIIDHNIYFGEMTFTSNGGYMDFYTDEFLNEMGKQIDLTNERKR